MLGFLDRRAEGRGRKRALEWPARRVVPFEELVRPEDPLLVILGFSLSGDAVLGYDPQVTSALLAWPVDARAAPEPLARRAAQKVCDIDVEGKTEDGGGGDFEAPAHHHHPAVAYCECPTACCCFTTIFDDDGVREYTVHVASPPLRPRRVLDFKLRVVAAQGAEAPCVEFMDEPEMSTNIIIVIRDAHFLRALPSSGAMLTLDCGDALRFLRFDGIDEQSLEAPTARSPAVIIPVKQHIAPGRWWNSLPPLGVAAPSALSSRGTTTISQASLNIECLVIDALMPRAHRSRSFVLLNYSARLCEPQCGDAPLDVVFAVAWRARRRDMEAHEATGALLRVSVAYAWSSYVKEGPSFRCVRAGDLALHRLVKFSTDADLASCALALLGVARTTKSARRGPRRESAYLDNAPMLQAQPLSELVNPRLPLKIARSDPAVK